MTNLSALIGYTGFVGSNLATQHHFDALYNSKNIDEIAGRCFDLLVVSAMPAAMWIANKDPEGDRLVLERLIQSLRQTRAEKVFLMSTVAVYPNPVAVDEESPIDAVKQTPYGHHRLLLETFAKETFPRVLAVRLPGLFGPGLKKNAIYDLIHNNEVHKLNHSSIYQFYNLDRLWADCSTALKAGLDVVNFATEPMNIQTVAKEVFDLEFTNDPGTPPAHFDMQSRHANVFGGKGRYLYDRRQVLQELREFVHKERLERKTP